MYNFFTSNLFGNFATFAEMAKEWELDFIQLDRGQFDAKLTQFGDHQVMVAECHFSRHLHQRGVSPPGYFTFAIYGPNSVTHRWRLLDCPANSVRIFPKDNELNSVTPPDFHNLVITIAEDYLGEIALKLGFPEPNKLAMKGAVVNCAPSAIKVMQESIQGVVRHAEYLHNYRLQPILKEHIKWKLIRSVLRALASAKPIRYSKPRINKNRVLKRVLEYLDENIHEEITILQLCNVAEVSERSLRYTFTDYFSVNPNKYLLNFRLNRIRTKLAKLQSGKIKISDIANSHGLWHMGKFAADYRGLFDELPSQTIDSTNNDKNEEYK